MKAENLSGAMAHFSDKLLREADTSRKMKKSPRHWLGWAVAAACVCITCTLGLGMLRENPQNAAPGSPSQTEEMGGYLSYAGPILPLCMAEEREAITARRALTLDFSDGQENYCQVTDAYTIYNSGTTDAVITLEYPYADSLKNSARPTIFVSGEKIAYETAVGEILGLSSSVNQWEQYQTALADGTYLQRALKQVSAPEETAVVYFVTELTQVSANEDGAPSIDLHFQKNAETVVLSYGFNGGVYGDADGWQSRSFFLPRQESGNAEQLRCLIVLGGDVEQLTVQGYTDGSLEKPRDDITAVVTRQEMPLAQVLSLALEDMYRQWETNEGESWPPEGISSDACMTQVQRALPEFLEETREGYDTGELELLFTRVHGGKRVLYCTLELTIPAGGEIEVTAFYEKAGSYDYPGTNSAREGIYGYEAAASLASGITMTEQTARVQIGDNLEIASESFGFASEQNGYSASLDAQQEVYTLEVREKRQ